MVSVRTRPSRSMCLGTQHKSLRKLGCKARSTSPRKYFSGLTLTGRPFPRRRISTGRGLAREAMVCLDVFAFIIIIIKVVSLFIKVWHIATWAPSLRAKRVSHFWLKPGYCEASGIPYGTPPSLYNDRACPTTPRQIRYFWMRYWFNNIVWRIEWFNFAFFRFFCKGVFPP